jgi:hypothetical protein
MDFAGQQHYRKPVIFLSSVFGGFLSQRQKLRGIITNEFNFQCLTYESDAERFGGAPRRACLQAVDSADLYIGVFWKRAGSIPTYLIIEKEYAKGLLNTGHRKAASSLLTSLYELARQEGLSQQAQSIGVLLNRAVHSD